MTDQEKLAYYVPGQFYDHLGSGIKRRLEKIIPCDIEDCPARHVSCIGGKVFNGEPDDWCGLIDRKTTAVINSPLWVDPPKKKKKATLPLTEHAAFDIAADKYEYLAKHPSSKRWPELNTIAKKYGLTSFKNDCPLCEYFHNVKDDTCTPCISRCSNLRPSTEDTCYNVFNEWHASVDDDDTEAARINALMMATEFRRIADSLPAEDK
jgi:hypothetical protein